MINCFRGIEVRYGPNAAAIRAECEGYLISVGMLETPNMKCASRTTSTVVVAQIRIPETEAGHAPVSISLLPLPEPCKVLGFQLWYR